MCLIALACTAGCGGSGDQAVARACSKVGAAVRAAPPYSKSDRQVQTLRAITAAYGDASLALRRDKKADAQRLAAALGRVNLLGAELEQEFDQPIPGGAAAMDHLAAAAVKDLASAAAATHVGDCTALVAPTRNRLRV